jgi:asparagine synthase (glutamine-hydrolysing)
MCGIAGLISLDRSPVDPQLLRRMAESLAHRGPDALQTWIDPDRPWAGLAHARLAVLDREGGRQPMADVATGGCRVVFNGEIYNHRDLRAALQKRQHRFASDHSDTEVLLSLYREYGGAMVDRLRGMFAFAVYDGPAARLLLARDRMGQKPLYWTRTDTHLAFASELKTLMLAPGVSRTLDLDALHLYLQLGYVPSPMTIFRGVRKLPPGSRMVVPLDPVPAALASERYWSPPMPIERGHVPDDDPAAYAEMLELLGDRPALGRELRRRLADAVAVRMESDVPLGVFLSGGIDSSLVAALARKAEPGRHLRTFSVAMPDSRYDESVFAEQVATHIGAEHTRLEAESGHLLASLECMASVFDEPFADSSAIPTYLMAQAARQHITVALSGDGGDEAFGGYDRYRAVRLAAKLDASPVRRRILLATARLCPRGLDLKSRRSRLRRFADVLGLSPLDRYARWVSPFHESDPAAFYSDRLRGAIAAGATRQYLDQFTLPGRPFADSVMRLDAMTYLPEDVLTKVDRASMAHGLEVRSPLLDHHVVAFAMRLPAEVRLGSGSAARLQKILLRDVARELLPRKIVARGKMGFGVPISAWLAGEDADAMKKRLADGPAASAGLIDARCVEGYVDAHTRRRADHGPRLYSLLVLDEFLRQHDVRCDL